MSTAAATTTNATGATASTTPVNTAAATGSAAATGTTAVPAVQPIQTTPVPFQSASLYVGSLHPDVTESLLFELFNQVGPVASIRVCRETITRRSLGYGYVNFHNVQDAERALDTMNFTEIKGKACRIMWSQRDPSLRKSGVGNVVIHNLAPSVDHKGLYDLFSVFGNILSCTVVEDMETLTSKGYGYVHFETAEDADRAIKELNGMVIEEFEVKVSNFVKRNERAGQADWTNLYVKHFPTSWDEDKLKSLFDEYGAILTVALQRGEDGKSKGFGFVNFEKHESAAKALDALANKEFQDDEGKAFELYVGRHKKKNERKAEIKVRQDALNQEKITKYQGKNLYVKNIADSVTDEQFTELMATCGTITSAKIMRQDNEAKTSKGFGFVCYSSAEEATKAVQDMNNRSLGGKPLVVTLHQRKELRRAHLAQQFAPQNMPFSGGRMQGGMGMPSFMGMYMPQGQPNFPGQQSPRGSVNGPYGYGPGGNMMGRGPNGQMPRGNVSNFPGQRQQGNFFPGLPPYMQNPNQMNMGQGGNQMNARRVPGPNGGNFQGAAGGMQQGNRRGNMHQQGNMINAMNGHPQNRGPGMPMNNNRNQMPIAGGAMPNQQGFNRAGPGMVKFNNQARNQTGQQLQGMPMGMGMPQQQQQIGQMQQSTQAASQQGQGKSDFSDAALASADPLTQKNMIGELLYPLIHKHQPELAGKITGMLLEMDNGELLNLIESPDALESKITEALNVLRQHKTGAEEQ